MRIAPISDPTKRANEIRSLVRVPSIRAVCNDAVNKHINSSVLFFSCACMCFMPAYLRAACFAHFIAFCSRMERLRSKSAGGVMTPVLSIVKMK